MGFMIYITKDAITKGYPSEPICPAFIVGQNINFGFDSLVGVIQSVTWTRINEMYVVIK